MMRKLGLAMVLLLAAATPSFAGFYAGASIGNTTVQVDEPSFSFDADDSSWKAFAGFRFLKFVGVEASYVELGSPSDGSVTIESKGWDAFGVGLLPLGPFALFAKVGVMTTDTEITSLSDESSTDPAYGVGAEFGFSKIAIRAEYERFDIEDTDEVYMISVGAAFRF
jgi:outer membrane protein with beta-barrel domain